MRYVDINSWKTNKNKYDIAVAIDAPSILNLGINKKFNIIFKIAAKDVPTAIYIVFL